MAKLLRLRRGTTTQHGSFTGAEGEVTVDTDKDTLVVHDNATAGGRPLLREDLNNMPASGVTAGTYGSSSAIPAITVDAKGRVTSATTSAIDSTSIANGTSNVSVAASGDITLTRAGTTQATVIGGGLKFGDSKRAYWGDDTDLQIWHDGSNSHIKDNGTGNLIIEARNLTIRDISGENHITADVNSSVNLFHDNSQKLSTTSTGIDVTGTVACDGLTSDGTGTFHKSAEYQIIVKDNNNTGTAAETGIAFQDSAATVQSYIGHVFNNTEDLVITQTRNASIVFSTNNLSRCKIDDLGHLRPTSNNAYDLGTSSSQWRDGYFDGTVNCDGLNCVGDAVVKSSNGKLRLQDIDNSGVNNQNYIEGYNATNGTVWEVGMVSNGNQQLLINNAQNSDVQFATNNTNRCYVSSSGHFIPNTNNVSDLGDNTRRWRNVYTNDLNLSNEGGTNDVDGTWGSWTIQEGEDDLFLLNRRNGKKYKFNLSEVN
jgi:hypothetical protein